MRILKTSLTCGAAALAFVSVTAVSNAPAHAASRGYYVAAGAYAPVYRYSYVPAYIHLYRPHVVRCYPAHAAVVDQIGLITGYVNLGHCG